MMRGRLRIRGKRRKALKLRRMSSGDLSMAEVVEAGGTLDPDVLYRALPYLIDPDWTERTVAATRAWLTVNRLRILGAVIAAISLGLIAQGVEAAL